MTREDIIRMAREAGFVIDEASRQHQPNCIGFTHYLIDDELSRFAALVAAAEREACAKVCDVVIPGDEYSTALINSYADAIRARGEK